MPQPGYINHRKRLRRKFAESGIDSLQDYEKLELLLTFAIPRKDVKPVGKKLLDKFGTISRVMDSGIEELKKIDGLGEQSAVLIKLARELSTIYFGENIKERDLLKSPRSVVDYCRMKLGALENESFMVIFLDTKNRLIDHKVISEGSVNNVPIYPRKLIKIALDLNATGIILVHNHPSGNSEPSRVDKEITESIIQISGELEIRVLDHIIVSQTGYFSFLENNLV